LSGYHERSRAAPGTSADLNSFKKQFSSYLADDIGSEDIEELYTAAYEAIREDPVFKPTEKWKKESLARKQHKLTKAQREARVQEKIAAYKAGKTADVEDDEE
jgi:large subunit ribosomal protein L5e